MIKNSKSFLNNIGFGVTMYVLYRSPRVIRQSIAQSYNDVDKTTNLIALSDYDCYNIMVVLLSGILFQHPPVPKHTS